MSLKFPAMALNYHCTPRVHPRNPCNQKVFAFPPLLIGHALNTAIFSQYINAKHYLKFHLSTGHPLPAAHPERGTEPLEKKAPRVRERRPHTLPRTLGVSFCAVLSPTSHLQFLFSNFIDAPKTQTPRIFPSGPDADF